MQKNEEYITQITGITNTGSGVGRVENFAFFIPYVLLGETVRFQVLKMEKTYGYGKVLEVIEPSPHRIESECEYFGKCGGCQFWHVDYTEELEYKHRFVTDCLDRIGNLDVDVMPVLGAEKVSRYRNKAQFPVNSEGIGVYAARSHRVIPVSKCLIQDEVSDKVNECVRSWMKTYKIEPYNEITGNGAVRHVYTRVGQPSSDGGKETLVCIVSNTEKLPYSKELIESILALKYNITGIVQNINTKKTNVIMGNINITLWGRDFIYDSIGNKKFKISVNSFYQINSEQTKILYDKIAEFANPSGGEVLWDLYCGTGTIGLYLAGRVKSVIGVEIVEKAIENARENAIVNGISNATFYVGAAELISTDLIRQGKTPDIIIVDPPRKGCDRKLIDTIIETDTKKLIYVSCNPSTLARDLKILHENGYIIKAVQPVDMFPRTAHVETVVLLSKLKSKYLK